MYYNARWYKENPHEQLSLRAARYLKTFKRPTSSNDDDLCNELISKGYITEDYQLTKLGERAREHIHSIDSQIYPEAWKNPKSKKGFPYYCPICGMKIRTELGKELHKDIHRKNPLRPLPFEQQADIYQEAKSIWPAFQDIMHDMELPATKHMYEMYKASAFGDPVEWGEYYIKRAGRRNPERTWIPIIVGIISLSLLRSISR